LGVRGPVA